MCFQGNSSLLATLVHARARMSCAAGVDHVAHRHVTTCSPGTGMPPERQGAKGTEEKCLRLGVATSSRGGATADVPGSPVAKPFITDRSAPNFLIAPAGDQERPVRGRVHVRSALGARAGAAVAVATAGTDEQRVRR